MNPALPLLAAAALAPLLLLRPRPAAPAAGAETSIRVRFAELPIPWAVGGLLALALLAPALAIPDGIPSPAADLTRLAPWGEAGPATGNPVLRDVTFQIQPWLAFLRSELRAGRLPLWNPHQFAGAPFWANGQSAPLFPLHLLFVALPLGLGFVVLPWLRAVVAACGAFALAREVGCSRPAALGAAIVFPLSGMMVSFLLFPMGNALALVPWVLFAVERLARTGTGAPWLALFAGLQLLGGHPETSAHTALLAAVYLAVRSGRRQGLRTWLRFAGAWVLAAGLAAIQILPLLRLLPATPKWVTPESATGSAGPALSLLLRQPLRLVLPHLYGHAPLGTWWGPFNDSATAVYAGALALPFAVAGVAVARRDRRVRGIAVVLALSFLAAYHLPGVYDLLQALPVLGRAAHHRLLFGVELGLALMAAVGVDRWLAGRGRGLAVGAAIVGLGLATAWSIFSLAWSSRSLTAGLATWTAWVAAQVVLAVASLRLTKDARWRFGVPLVAALLVGDLLLAHGRILPGLSLARWYPRTGAIQFLERTFDRDLGRVAGVGEQLRPNAAMVYGLRDLRGDDPVKLTRFEEQYAELGRFDAVYLAPIERWDDARLDRWGVRYVVAGPAEAAPVPDWRLAYEGADARVYERPSALPLVRWPDGRRAGLTIREATPGHWRIGWQRPGGRGAERLRMVVAETWADGWRGEIDGRAVAVGPDDSGTALAIDLPAGSSGELVLRYQAPGLVAGAAISALALLVLAAGFRWTPRGSTEERPA